MKSSLSTYKNYLKKNLIKFDPNQESAMKIIDEFLSLEFSLKPKFYRNFLKRRKSKNGVYLYGEAGVGKIGTFEMGTPDSTCIGFECIRREEVDVAVSTAA